MVAILKHFASSTAKIGHSPWFFGVRENNAASYCHLSTDQLIGATCIEVITPEGTGVAQFDGCNPEFSENLVSYSYLEEPKG